MKGSILHKLHSIGMEKVVYKESYIRKSCGGLSIDQLLGGKYNTRTGDLIARPGNHLSEDEDWLDPGKLLARGVDVRNPLNLRVTAF